jgi:hypothetical protein
MAANLIALAIFVVSFSLRWIDVAGFLAVGLSILALGALAVAGWYGGELVFVHGMGVKPPRNRPASAGQAHIVASRDMETRYSAGSATRYERRRRPAKLWPFRTRAGDRGPNGRDLQLVI